MLKNAKLKSNLLVLIALLVFSLLVYNINADNDSSNYSINNSINSSDNYFGIQINESTNENISETINQSENSQENDSENNSNNTNEDLYLIEEDETIQNMSIEDVEKQYENINSSDSNNLNNSNGSVNSNESNLLLEQQNFSVFAIPTHTTPLLNTTSIDNLTSDNLTIYNQSTSDTDGDAIKNIIDWRLNGSSIAKVNLPFEAHASSSSKAIDYSTNGKNGTVNGATFNSTSGHDGFGAYSFDGINDYISLGSQSISGTLNDYTITTWLKSSSSGGTIYSEQSSSTNTVNYFFGVTNGVPKFQTNNGGWRIIEAEKLVNDSQWHHIALTFSTTTGTNIYVDGVLNKTNTSLKQKPTSPNRPVLGSYHSSSATPNAGRYNGLMSDFEIWDRVLSSEQILAIYNNRTDLIVSQETEIGDVWQGAITPNDGTGDGETLTSNNLTIMEYPSYFCSGNYIAPGDWIVNSSITCEDETIIVQGDLIVNITGSQDVNQFASSSSPLPTFDLRNNQADIGTSSTILDNLGTDASYTDNWDQTTGNTFKIKMNESMNRIQFFFDSTTNSAFSLYIDLDSSASTGLTAFGDGYGYDIALGDISALGLTGVVVSNASLNGPAEIGAPPNWFQNVNDGAIINSSESDDWQLNFTIHYKKSSDNLTYEVIIDRYGVDWDDVMVVTSNLDTSNLYTQFTNSEALFSAGDLTLNNINLKLLGNFTASENSILNINNSNITFKITNSTNEKAEFYSQSNNVEIENTNFQSNNSNLYYAFTSVGNYFNFTNGTINNICDNCGTGNNGQSGVRVLGDYSTLDQFSCGDSNENRCFQTGGTGIKSYPNYFTIKNSNLSSSVSIADPVVALFINNTIIKSLSVNNADGGLFSNNNITGTFSFGDGGSGINPENNTLLNNIFSGGYLTDQNSSLYNYLIYNNSLGQIKIYSNNLTLGSDPFNMSIGDKILIQYNLLGIDIENQANLANLNTSAELTFKQINFTGGIQLLKNGIRCDNNISLCNISVDESNNLVYANVSSFSNYTLLDTNVLPNHTNPVISTTTGVNMSYENITIYNQSTSDADGDTVKSIIDWRVNGSSIAVLNMPFEAHESSSSTAIDYSTNQNNGTINSATFNSTGGHDGFGVYEFDGIDDSINISSNLGLSTTGVTILTWVYLQTNSEDGPFVKIGDGTSGFGIGVGGSTFDDSGNNLILLYELSRWIDTDINIGTGWHHVGMVINDSGIPSAYIDGEVIGTYPGSTAIAPSNQTRIGGYSTFSRYFEGKVDEVMIYNRSLSSEQISAIYNNRTDLIVGQETNGQDVWQGAVTPNDRTGDGPILTSNNLTIVDNSVPTHSTPVLNSTTIYNLTTDNLTVYNQSSLDVDEDIIKNIIDWRVNGSSIAVLNMPFEPHINSGTIAIDYSNNQYNGILRNNPTYTSDGGFDGRGAYLFDGSGSYIEINSSSPINISTFTIESRIKISGSASGINQIYSNYDRTNGSSKGFSFITINGSLGCLVANGTGNLQDPQVISNTLVNDSAWHHTLCTFDGSNISVFIDGELDNSADFSGTYNKAISNISKISLESGDSFVNSFNGIIDEFRLYGRVLSQQQIDVLYNNLSNIIVNNETSKLDEWQSYITPNDNFRDGQSLASNTLIINIEPDLTSPEIRQPATKNNSLVVNTTFINGDLSTGSVYFEWFVNGTSVSNTSNLSITNGTILNSYLGNGNFSKSDIVYVSVYATDGYLNSSIYNTSIITIQNAPPHHTRPLLISETSLINLSNHNLSVFNRSTTDADGDNIKNIINWKRNSTSFILLNTPYEGGSNSTYTRDYGLGNNGSVNGSIWSSTGGYDEFGVYEFDGNLSYIDHGDVIFDGLTEFSIAFWVKLNDLDKDNTFISKGEFNTNQPILFWRDEVTSSTCNLATDSISLLVSDDSDEARICGNSGSYNDTDWHYVVGTFIGNNSEGLKLYIDGVLATTPVSTENVSSIKTSSNTLRIGNVKTPSQTKGLDGTLDELTIWNKSLSSQHIELLYNNITNTMTHYEMIPGEIWSADIIPNDGYNDGPAITSNTLTVFPPVLTIPVISPLVPYTNDTLIVNVTYLDGDEDQGNVTFMWFVNETNVFNQTNTSVNNGTTIFSYLGKNNFSKSDIINVTISSNDGIDNSSIRNAQTTIQDSPPTTPTQGVLVNDANITDSTPFFNWTSSTDIDGDSITYVLQIGNNSAFTILQDESSNLSVFNYTSSNIPDGIYYWRLIVYSGTSSTNSPTRNFTLDTVPPEINLISPINNGGYNNGNVTFAYNVSNTFPIKNCSLYYNGSINQTDNSITKDISQTFTLNGLSIGSHNWSIGCTDIIDSSTNSTTYNFTISLLSQFTEGTTDLSQEEVESISTFTFGNSYGEIRYLTNINLSGGLDIDSNVNMSQNEIFLNSSALPQLNESARLTLKNLSFSNPRVLKNGEVCSDCTEVSYSGGNFVFDVSSFSTYSSEETPESSSGSDSSSSSGSGSVRSGGSSSGILFVAECNYDSDCAYNEYCDSYKCEKSECNSNIECGYGYYCDNHKCSSLECQSDLDCSSNQYCFNQQCVTLFDVKILRADSPIEPGQDLDFTYLMKGVGEVNTDVFVKYWVKDENGRIVSSGEDAIFLASYQQKNEDAKLYIPNNVEYGNYNLIVEVSFGAYSAKSQRVIEIGQNVPLILEVLYDQGILDNVKSQQQLENNITFTFNKDGKYPVNVVSELFRGEKLIWSYDKNIEVDKKYILTEEMPKLDPGYHTFKLIAYYGEQSLSPNESEFVSLFQEFKVDASWNDYEFYLVPFLIILLSIILIVTFIIERGKFKKALLVEAKWIKKHPLTTILLFLLLLGLIVVIILNYLQIIVLPQLWIYIKIYSKQFVELFYNHVIPVFQPNSNLFYYVIGGLSGLFILILVFLILLFRHRRKSKLIKKFSHKSKVKIPKK